MAAGTVIDPVWRDGSPQIPFPQSLSPGSLRLTVETSLRMRALAFAIATMLAGLAWHYAPVPIRSLHDIVGDALWAMMMAWLIAAAMPRSRVVLASAAALFVCYAVEFSQLLHTPALDALRRTTIGRLVLGNGFDPRDLVAYAAGVTIVALMRRTRASRD